MTQNSDSVLQDPISTIFFDLGDTLGTPEFSRPSGSMTGFRVYPDVPPILAGLKDAGYRLGIISNTGDEDSQRIDEILDSAGMLTFFEDVLRIYSYEAGWTKESPMIFRLAAARAGLAEAPGCCLYVGESAAERAVAQEAGFRVCPSPDQVREMLGRPANEANFPKIRKR